MNERMIIIHGDFTVSLASEVINKIEVLSDKSPEDITLVIDSYGGSCDGCFGILDAMDRSRCDIITIAVGKSMSAGGLILASGTKGKRLALPNATVMYHEPNGMAFLSIKGLECMRFFKDLQEELYSEITGRSVNYIEELLNKDLFLTADVAREHGFIDGVVGSIYSVQQ